MLYVVFVRIFKFNSRQLFLFGRRVLFLLFFIQLKLKSRREERQEGNLFMFLFAWPNFY